MRLFIRLTFIVSLVGLCACYSGYSLVKPKSYNNTPVLTASNENTDTHTDKFLAALPKSTPNRQLLAESWDSYRHKFIQADGRVIDYQASAISTSEGQGYAMLRAVLIDDPATFDLTLKWSENNLQRQANGKRTDSLWAWKWGQNKDGWGVIDSNFASDADIDAITALIFAYRRWHRPEYLQLAKIKLQDLWNLATVTESGGKRYLLPGPASAFKPNPSLIYLNPSYLAPYAFRIFAQVDAQRNWLSLVDSSYEILEKSTSLSTVGLPSDWVALNTITNQFQPLPQSSTIQSLYSFDAYRVWWRLSLDAAWFDSPQAWYYLRTSSGHLQTLWHQQSRLPARIDLHSQALVDYEATSQYAMVYAAWALIQPELAKELLAKKLLPEYNQGIWGKGEVYYTQNLAWLGLFPPAAVPQELLKARS